VPHEERIFEHLLGRVSRTYAVSGADIGSIQLSKLPSSELSEYLHSPTRASWKQTTAAPYQNLDSFCGRVVSRLIQQASSPCQRILIALAGVPELRKSTVSVLDRVISNVDGRPKR
jgi:hypothetical protein